MSSEAFNQAVLEFLFNGESALDWILRGRISETAARYEAALSYQA